MQVILVGKNFMNKLILPKDVNGNYWINDEDSKKVINIQAKNGKWEITSTNLAKIRYKSDISTVNNEITYVSRTGNDNCIDSITLEENDVQYFTIGESKNIYLLYCLPVYADELYELKIKNIKELTIGKIEKSSIIFKNPLVNPTHVRMIFYNGAWRIENLDLKIGTFVNEKPVTSVQEISNGDVIFILGLRIIMLRDRLFLNGSIKDIFINKEHLLQVKESNAKFKENSIDEEEASDNFYEEKDYFLRAPRIIKMIEKEEVKIDPPPAAKNKEEMPAILVLGSTISMGAIMLTSSISSLNGLISGTATFLQSLPALITALLMLISMVLFPILTRKYEKNQKERYEKKRQDRYRKYINSKAEAIDEIMMKQRQILFNNYISSKDCETIINNKTPRLWERKIEDKDFLSIRVGVGEVPLEIDIHYPEESFTMEDDELVDILNIIGKKSQTLENVPIAVSLAEKNIAGIIGENDEFNKKYLQNIILQLIALHSYEDLKLVFLVNEDNCDDDYWEYVKLMPHVWDNQKQIRFFADNYNEMQEISRYLEPIFKSRVEMEDDRLDYRSFSPNYLIITDSYKELENLRIISEILKTEKNVGFSVLFITNNINQLPNGCKSFIMLEKEKGKLFENMVSSSNQKEFAFDKFEHYNFDVINKTISNIPIRFNAQGAAMLPNSYNFMEMYDVGKADQLNVLDRWRQNDSTISLQAPIGIDTSGMPIILDIHEKAHGPHGLIAGSTGSGKSEFIITYILSLALNYSPNDVNFVLIDYKGGGLAGAFKKKNAVLPHLAGTITNIDTAGLQRSLDSIQSELRRRQIMFNEARNLTNESTIDIYKYQKLYHDGIVKKPIPHLLIICDEFAELKQQQPDFMDELISVARIGRSLGVHLILATQKPAGIVNDQIRSNSKFGICLKVQDSQDSMDIIKRPDAANLKVTGQFYMQVGNDEYFALGQSAYAGAQYFPTDVVKKHIDTSIEFINNTGVVVKKINNKVQVTQESDGDQLTAISKYLYQVSKENHIKASQLWLDNIPEDIYLEQIKEKYNVENTENVLDPVIGEYDDPYNQRQGILKLSLSEDGNMIIYGSADSGKETLISTLVYDLAISHSSNEVWSYILDFGSEALKIFKELPQVGDVVFVDEEEKVRRLFDMLQAIIRERKSILSEYNGDYKLYLEKSKKAMPMIVVIINNYEAFTENYMNEYEDLFQTLTREGIKFGISFIITANTPNDVRYRLAQNFKKILCLQLNNEDDYMNVFDKVGKKRPSRLFGRGLVSLNDGNIYEFQTAKICESNDWNEKIQQTIDEFYKTKEYRVKPIPVIPEKVEFKNIKADVKEISNLPIGIQGSNLQTYTYDFTKNLVNIISSKTIEDSGEFVYHIIDEINLLEDVELIIFDGEAVKGNKSDLKQAFEKFETKLQLINPEKKAAKLKKQICVIIGFDKFLSGAEIDEFRFNLLLKKAEEVEICNFIIVDNAVRLKNHGYEEWYKSYVMGDSGIWVGNGVSDQYLISTNVSSMDKEIVNNCGRSIGYAIKQGNVKQVKLLEMKEESD